MKKLFFIIPFLIMVSGCDERYRYPCQNPENWENKYCKKPYCSANGTCPGDLAHYEKERNGQQFSQPKINNQYGGCK